MWKTKFSSHKQYLFGLLFYRNAKKVHAGKNILQTFYSVLKETCHKTLKVAAAKNSFSGVCTSLIQLASMNVFYS